MSDEAESTQSVTEPHPKPQSPYLRPIVMTAVAIILLMIVAWGGNMRTHQAKIAEIERSVDALSEAIEPTVLNNDPARLSRALLSIAEAGKYKSVTYSDNSGKILASTDQVRLGKKSDEMAKSPQKAKATNEKGSVVVRRAVILAGDTRLGNIEVVLN
ncbi:MAG: hypothetical protein KF824_03085 [Fimbriimonadaceae bacterium]|nr:MAG: hypothetical protein KF824_03085 [Fimbriimonadaceae bacterium]